MKLHRQLDISYNAAWRMKHKLMQVMMERDDSQPLSGFVELDGIYMGGERTGSMHGRGAEGKTPFVAAEETTQNNEPIKVKLTVMLGFRKTAIELWSCVF